MTLISNNKYNNIDPSIQTLIKFLILVFTLPAFIFACLFSFFIFTYRWGVMLADIIELCILNNQLEVKKKT